MSGSKCGEYTVSDAALDAWVREQEQARQREAERVALAQQRWQAAQAERALLLDRAAALARRHRLQRPAVPPLANLVSWDAETVARGLARAAAVANALEHQVAAMTVEGRAAAAREVADSLHLLDAGFSRAGSRAAQPASGPDEQSVQEAAEVSRIVRRLDPEVGMPQPVSRMLAEIAAAPAGRRRVLVDQLREEVRACNRAAELRRQRAAALAEALETAKRINDPVLRLLVVRALAEDEAGVAVNVAAVAAAAEDAERRYEERRSELRRSYVEHTVVAAFEALGYEVLTRIGVQTPDAGVLVRRGSSSPHAVRVVVTGERIDVALVRLVAAGRPHPEARSDAERAEDIRAEEALCRDALDETSPLWRAVSGAGIDVAVTPTRPGAVAPPAVEVPAAMLVSGRNGHVSTPSE